MRPSTPKYDAMLHVRHAVVHAVAWHVLSCVGHADPLSGKTALWQLLLRLSVLKMKKPCFVFSESSPPIRLPCTGFAMMVVKAGEQLPKLCFATI